MTPLRRLKYLWPAWRRREESEMREELESLAAMAGTGELGNLTLALENVRATWGWTWLESIVADIRYSIRALWHQPAFVAVAVLSLGLAVGATGAIFSFADALMLRPLPVPDASNVFDVGNVTPDNPLEGMSFPDYRDFREESRSFSGLIAYRVALMSLATDPSAAARIRFGALVSDNFFAALGVVPAGRGFFPEEAASPGRAVAIVSSGLAGEFASGRSIIGETLRIDGIVFTVVGVAPPSFTGLDRFVRPSVYLPLGMAQRLAAAAADPLEDRGRHDLVVKGRLGAGSTAESAQAELAVIGSALENQYPKTDRNRRPVVRTELARRILQNPQMLSLIKMLMGLVGLILIIACSNLANLQLVRARARSREIAIRLSIGAGRRRLIRQLMTESLLVSVLSGVVGLLFAYGGILLLGTLSVPSDPPNPLGIELDWRVVDFSLIIAVGSCVFFGLAPAWQTARMDFNDALKAGGRGTAGERRTLGRDVLVIGQIALAMVVLVAAGMFLSGFRKMLALTPEFRVDHVITMDTAPALVHYTPEQTKAFYRQLVDRARAMPGVRAAAMSEAIPLAPAQTTLTVVPEGYQFPKGREKTIVFGAAVDAAYFSTMRVEIVRGRAFTDADSVGTRRVAIVNEQFAKRYWSGQDPIGKRVKLESTMGPEAEVVGVAKSGHYLVVNEPLSPYVYVPYDQNPRSRMTLIVESAGNPADLAAPLRNLVRSIDSNVPVFNVRPVATLYESRATGTWLQFFQLVGTLGLIGLVLATAGLYGLVAYTVSRRVKEFGIRVALGARRRDVAWLVVGRGLVLASIGIALGAALTVVAAPMLGASFLGLGTSPSAAYAFVPILLVTISAAASYLPARRAAGLDPVRTLRDD